MGQPSRTNPFRSALLVVCAGAVALGSRAVGQIAATAVVLQRPCAIAYDAQGDLFFSERSGEVVRKLTAAGTLMTVAGTGVQGFAGDGGAATAAELDSPCGLALDSAGNLYVADTRNDRIREIAAATGVITTIAGTGTAGFAGDGGQASTAELSGPAGLAVDGAGGLYIADTGNQRVRLVSAAGVISTAAGTGVQGFSGDGGPAGQAELDSPSGLAVDGAGNLLIADTRNERVREVLASDGTIRTVAGQGVSGPGLPVFSGDGGAASAASLALPSGVTVDAGGNVYVADRANQRVRRIDAASGTITTVAGSGVQGFAGDGQAATAANLDSPRAATVSPDGLVTLTDTANGRIRQLDTSAPPEIHTVAGLGAELATGGLVLSGPSAVVYGGAGVITAVLANGSGASGVVTFLGGSASSPVVLGTAGLNGGTAQLSTAGLTAGTYSITASFPGDGSHAAVQSQALTLRVTPLAVTASATAVSMLYGRAVPALSGTLTGVLPADTGNVSVVFSTAASALSGVGSYPITATLTGSAAGNYTVGSSSGMVVIGKAPTTTTLTLSGAGSVSVQTASSTAGVPSGSVTLLDGGSLLGTVALAAGGAAFSSSSLLTGDHSLTAVYGGDSNFVGSTSAALAIVSSPGTTAGGNFTIVANGNSSASVPSGSSAVYSFSMSPDSGGLTSPVDLTVSGLGVGMTASFNPAYLPPSGATTPFTLTVQTTKTARLADPPGTGGAGGIAAALLIVPYGWALRRRRRESRICGTTFPLRGVIMASAACILFATLASGCGDRMNVGTEAESAPTYTLTITGTATSASGTLVQHSLTVTLQVL